MTPPPAGTAVQADSVSQAAQLALDADHAPPAV